MLDSPIILNEREARKARAALTRIDKLLSSNTYFSAVLGRLPPEVLGMHENALRGARKSFAAMLEGYEKAQSGEFAEFAERWRSEPGVVLIIARIARGLSQAELANRLAMREQQIQRYESERYRSISLQNFKRVAAVLGVDLQAIVVSEQTKPLLSAFGIPHQPDVPDEQLKVIIEHAKKSNWFSVPADSAEQRRVVLDYIGESHTKFGSPGLLRTGLKSLDLKDDALLAAWRARVIQRADVVGTEMQATFDHLDISWLADLVRLSGLADGPKQALRLAQEKGIIVIIEPQLKGLRLDGAAFLSGGTPVIGLTLRNDRLDNFWYTLFHELAHVYLHYLTGLAAGFFDEELEDEKTDDLELEADQFASSALIPPEAWRLSPARISRSAGPIEGFANQLGIHPAIVFGRIRRERHNYSIFSDRVGFGVVKKQLSSA
ncbi:ImmA/IrrE family metallo-endopeptidase [Bradyrhizobium liaoningense]|uniref:XRE family transcriptional regulator n=1 Tax=Bradyrhizobium liaoningense TaxID=43992 RepID=UPI001BA5F0B3|nr:XRE family transcriptional regulator [Bradyrhizobium liaoningense]MBR0838674.1 ImmA/IrrE family metallo-endopeptidase [Bradyrhizobium liaoningense]